MLAQRKIAYDESQKNYKQMKTKKLVKVEQAKNVNVNNALRSRCINFICDCCSFSRNFLYCVVVQLLAMLII